MFSMLLTTIIEDLENCLGAALHEKRRDPGVGGHIASLGGFPKDTPSAVLSRSAKRVTGGQVTSAQTPSEQRMRAAKEPAFWEMSAADREASSHSPEIKKKLMATVGAAMHAKRAAGLPTSNPEDSWEAFQARQRARKQQSAKR